MQAGVDNVIMCETLEPPLPASCFPEDSLAADQLTVSSLRRHQASDQVPHGNQESLTIDVRRALQGPLPMSQQCLLPACRSDDFGYSMAELDQMMRILKKSANFSQQTPRRQQRIQDILKKLVTENYENRHWTLGRRCDTSCAAANPLYGFTGCYNTLARDDLTESTADKQLDIADQLKYGPTCRICFNYLEEAKSYMTELDTTVIMCDTGEPPSAYRGLQTPRRLRELAGPKSRASLDDPAAGICALVRSDMSTMDMLHTLLQSFVTHWPQVQVVIAAPEDQAGHLSDALGQYNSVKISGIPDIRLADLNADQLCGSEYNLIFHVPPGVYLSRTPLGKDLFDARDRVLVHWAEPAYLQATHNRWAEASEKVLGWAAPIFTHGQDVVLPAVLHSTLREFLLVRYSDNPDPAAVLHAVPGLNMVETLCAWGYGHPPPQTRFYNTAAWTRQHVLSRNVSIWDVPMIKPRFTAFMDLGADAV